MPTTALWSISRRILAGTLILYSVMVAILSLHILHAAITEGSSLNSAAITVETLTLLFLPMLLLGLWKPRPASALLFVAALALLVLTLLTPHAAPSTIAGMIGASLLVVGVPMLASAIFFHLIARPMNA